MGKRMNLILLCSAKLVKLIFAWSRLSKKCSRLHAACIYRAVARGMLRGRSEERVQARPNLGRDMGARPRA